MKKYSAYGHYGIFAPFRPPSAKRPTKRRAKITHSTSQRNISRKEWLFRIRPVSAADFSGNMINLPYFWLHFLWIHHVNGCSNYVDLIWFCNWNSPISAINPVGPLCAPEAQAPALSPSPPPHSALSSSPRVVSEFCNERLTFYVGHCRRSIFLSPKIQLSAAVID